MLLAVSLCIEGDSVVLVDIAGVNEDLHAKHRLIEQKITVKELAVESLEHHFVKPGIRSLRLPSKYGFYT